MASIHSHQELFLWTQSGLKTAGKLQKLHGFMLEGWFSPVKDEICVGHVLQQIKNGQFIFANYRVLRYVISAKCCSKNLPFSLSKPVNTLEISLFSEQLWSNALFH